VKKGGAFRRLLLDRTPMAVMVDTFLPLSPTLQASALEDAGYQASWRSALPAPSGGEG
jgi:homogentisate 1,2-dioxygenase